MKGGITSGVVYPHALCELARTYRFVNVGGTSAGAIAAAGAAAAEHGRDRGGFAKLAAASRVGRRRATTSSASSSRSPAHGASSGSSPRGSAARARASGSASARRPCSGFPLAAVAGLAPGVALVVWRRSRGRASAGLRDRRGRRARAPRPRHRAAVRLVTGLPRAVGATTSGSAPALPDGGATRPRSRRGSPT